MGSSSHKACDLNVAVTADGRSVSWVQLWHDVSDEEIALANVQAPEWHFTRVENRPDEVWVERAA